MDLAALRDLTYLRDCIRDPADTQICQQENDGNDEEHQGEEVHLRLHFVIWQLECHDQARQQKSLRRVDRTYI